MRGHASAAVFALCTTVTAQIFNEPTFYMWGAYPPGHTPSTPLARKFIQPHLLTNGWDTNKTALAEAMGAEIASEITAGRLTVDTVAVLLQSFGTDSGACDSTQGNNNLEPPWGGLRFFWNEDRIPGVYEWDTEGTSLTRFPDSRNADGRGSDNGDEPNICVGSPSASGQWVEVGTYDFVAPISGDGRIRARVAFRTPRVVGAVYSQCNLGLPHKSRLRLVQQSSASFESRYDLVQLTPILGLEDEPPAEPLMRSDVNHDGFADAVDVQQFLADWMESHPGADFDQDEFVTPDDVDSFVAAFSSGT